MAQPTDQADYDDELQGGAVASGQEKAMGFLDHLEDLRWTLVKSAIAFMAFAVLIGVFLQQFNEALLWPLNTVKAEYPQFSLDLGTTSIMEGFTVVLQMCFMGGLVMSAPFVMFFVGQFVAPALNERELKMVLPTCGAAMVLFLVGAAFSFFLLVPSTMRVSVELNEIFGFTMRWTPGAYYSLLIWLVLGVGAAFEFPLLIVLLVVLGMVTTKLLRGWWRHALLAAFIVAAIVTPTPDPITQTMLALPLYGLFWIAILVASQVERRKAAAEEEDGL